MSFNSDYIRQPTTTWLTRSLVVKSRVKRMRRTCDLYRNSVSTFRPFLKLMFDIELNPGPNGSLKYSAKANTSKANNIKIAHLNIRSLKCRDHFLLVKDTFIK